MQATRRASQKEKEERARNADEGIEEDTPSIEESWLQSLQSMITLIRSRFERLLLKEKQVRMCFVE